MHMSNPVGLSLPLDNKTPGNKPSSQLHHMDDRLHRPRLMHSAYLDVGHLCDNCKRLEVAIKKSFRSDHPNIWTRNSIQQNALSCVLCGFIFVTVWALPRPTLVRVGIAHVRSCIYTALPTSDSQFSAVLPPFSTVTILQSERWKLWRNDGDEHLPISRGKGACVADGIHTLSIDMGHRDYDPIVMKYNVDMAILTDKG